MGRRSVAGMLKLVRSIVSVVACRFRRRVVHDRPLALGLALPIVAALSGGEVR